jgi:hypothetical protein
MKDSKLAEGGLGKKRDIKIAKGLIKSLQGVDNEASREMKALMNEVLKGGYKPVKKAMGGEVMDTTKSMPVGMMDGGKVKPMKMNMGGVVPGRGGKFKGVR